MSEPRDAGAYRIAVAAIGCALVIALAGLCVIVAVGVESKEIPSELWTVTSALGGGLLGLLAPAPTPTAADAEEVQQVEKTSKRLATIVIKDLWANRSVVVLLFVFGVAVWLGGTQDSTEFQALAGASGAALIGLLAPPPSKDANGG